MTLSYNANDQLEKVTDSTGNTVVEYTYDSQGRRIEVDDRDFVIAPMVGTGLDSPHLVADGTGEVVSRYVYAGAMPLMRLDENGTPVYYLADAMGSVIGLADNGGGSAASFHYDSFGNLRGSSGGADALPELAGGDFRFQGHWLEESTDLYHFRARYYDPEVGRFISRDPVDIIETAPESSNPYQFVYNNPLIYLDPTGEIVLGDLLASSKMRDILQSIKTHASQQAKDYLTDRAKGVAGDIIQSTLKNLLPFSFGNIPKLEASGKHIGAGIAFENIITGAFCKVISGSFPQFTQHAWMQPRISTKGNPQDDGFACGSRIPGNQELFKHDLYKWHPRPDFLIKDGGPRTTDKNPKAFFIGDFKLAGKTILSSRRDRPRQWSAIMNYAAYENGHQYAPVALFVTLHKPSQAEYKKIKKEASPYKVDPVVAHIWNKVKK
ncbi:MAG: RHS repeat-associated core domain-containing protein [Kamptonema sp. SIO1D9]|nr:RHS repeat-associated core domain-containing protein [Kamptonema sp. SIO1D9]